MIQKMNYLNPITNEVSELAFGYPNLDYGSWKRLKDHDSNEDIINILDDILKSIDCTKEYSCGRTCMTTYPIYNIYISEYHYYILKFNNQILYNKYIDLLIQRHIDNLIFEYNNPYIPKTKNKYTKKKGKKAVPNQFIKQTSKDLFTGESTYYYENLHTKEVIRSDNPNLLEELNKPIKTKKVVKKKEIGVPISAMTFSFSKTKK